MDHIILKLILQLFLILTILTLIETACLKSIRGEKDS